MAKILLALCFLFSLSLPVNGDCSPDVSKDSIRAKVQNVYTSQIGILEKSNRNDGAGVEKYLGFCGRHRGDEWCSAFVSWCFAQAGVKTLITPWSPLWYDKRKLLFKQGWKGPVKRPRRGDVVLYWIHHKGRIGHVGFFDTYGEKYCITVEGNTNVDAKHGVHRIRRYWKSFYAIVDRIS